MQSPPAPITSSLFHSTIFSNNLSLCSSFNVRDQDTNPYKTAGKIIVLYALTFLDSKLAWQNNLNVMGEGNP